MKPSAVELHELREGYRVIAGGFETKFAYETHRTTRRRVRGVVVSFFDIYLCTLDCCSFSFKQVLLSVRSLIPSDPSSLRTNAQPTNSIYTVNPQLTPQEIVPKSSAVIADCPGAENLAIHADHEGMVRFKGPREEGFKTLAGHLTLMARKAPGVVGRRWERG